MKCSNKPLGGHHSQLSSQHMSLSMETEVHFRHKTAFSLKWSRLERRPVESLIDDNTESYWRFKWCIITFCFLEECPVTAYISVYSSYTDTPFVYHTQLLLPLWWLQCKGPFTRCDSACDSVKVFMTQEIHYGNKWTCSHGHLHPWLLLQHVVRSFLVRSIFDAVADAL